MEPLRPFPLWMLPRCFVLFLSSNLDWDSATLSSESLLDTVSRFVLAALLKHTNLLSQASGESRQVSQADSVVFIFCLGSCGLWPEPCGGLVFLGTSQEKL